MVIDTGRKVSGASRISISEADSHIAVVGKSFYSAKDNFYIRGVNRPQESYYSVAREFKRVKINLENSSYSISTQNDNGVPVSIIGSMMNDDFVKIYILADFHNEIEVNKNLGMEIAVSNNSNKRVYITLINKNSKVTITDRNGRVINGESGSENTEVISG